MQETLSLGEALQAWLPSMVAILKQSSNVQSTIALSTGESEYYALVKGGSVGLGLQSLLQDFGVEVEVLVESDATAHG